jgi:lipopolysaccharide/colanic/teichoic acid biosynthesis glycosyltransferase
MANAESLDAGIAPAYTEGAQVPLGISSRASYGVGAARIPTFYERFTKPVLDRVIGLVLLIGTCPVLVVSLVLTRIALGRPAILRQYRIGRDGKPFRIYKLRTMRPDRRSGERRIGVDRRSTTGCVPTERRLAERRIQGSERRLTHKHPDDPRLVPLGRVFRKWSIDELPQLWNVVKGEMSLVGPRPELPEIVARYEPWQHRRHVVKPGITGRWQVLARGDGPMHEHTDIDLQYVDHMTFLGDLKIVLWTIPAVLGHRPGF